MHPDALRRIDEANEAGQRLIARMRAGKRTKMAATLEWTHAFQLASFEQQQVAAALLREYEQTTSPDSSLQQIEEELELASIVLAKTRAQVVLLGESGVTWLEIAMRRNGAIFSAEEFARSNILTSRNERIREFKLATIDVIRERSACMTILKQQWGRWRYLDDGSMEVDDEFPDDVLEEYNLTVDRLHAAAAREAELQERALAH